jgi:hypothetical protein
VEVEVRQRLKQFGVALAVLVTVLGLARLVRGDDGEELCDVATAIRTLQPTADLERADRLAEVFHGAGRAYRLDPLLLVALGFRESSLLADVELRRRRGALGELGLMQSHGAALQVRPVDCSHHLVRRGAGREGLAYCQVRTGAAWLAEAREHCGGSMWRWVGAYGMGQCPSEGYARTMRSTQRARELYCRVADCETRWPR